jgi:hypothetical protein
MLASGTFGGLVVSMLASSTFGGLVVSMLASSTQVRRFKLFYEHMHQATWILKIMLQDQWHQHQNYVTRSVAPTSKLCYKISGTNIKMMLQDQQHQHQNGVIML